MVPRAIIASRSSSLSILMPLNTTNFAFRHSIIGCSNSRAMYLPRAIRFIASGTMVLDVSRLPAERASFTLTLPIFSASELAMVASLGASAGNASSFAFQRTVSRS